MELPHLKSTFTSTMIKKIKPAWLFMRDTHIEYFLVRTDELMNILDDFLAEMYIVHNEFEDRFKTQKTDITYGNESIHHIAALQKSRLDIYVNINEMSEVYKFYEKLISIVDDAMKKKYQYGHKFNKKELDNIHKSILSMNFEFCPANDVVIVVHKRLFDDNKFLELIEYDGKIRFFENNDRVVVRFYNSRKHFMSNHLWNVRDACYYPVIFSVDWNKLDMDLLVIHINQLDNNRNSVKCDLNI